MKVIIRYFLFFCLHFMVLPNGCTQTPVSEICLTAEKKLYLLEFTEAPGATIDSIHILLPILEAEACWEIYTACLIGLATAHYYNRDYVNSRQYAQSAFDRAKDCCPDSEIYAWALKNLAVSIGSQGIDLLKEALALEEKVGSDQLSLAYLLENLALAYQEIGDYATAINYYQLAKTKVKNYYIQPSHEEARLLKQIADCLKHTDEYALAFSNYFECLDILKDFSKNKFYIQTKWYATLAIAELYLQENAVGKAQEYALKAIAMQENKKLLEAYQSWIVLGDIYERKNQHEKALESYKKAEDLSRQEFLNYNQHEALARPLFKIGELQRKEKIYHQSLISYQKALQYLALNFSTDDVLYNPNSEQLINQYEAIKILQGKAACFAALYRQSQDDKFLLAAKQNMQLGSELLQIVRQNYLTQDSKHILIDDFHNFYEQAIAIDLMFFGQNNSVEQLESAFRFAEHNKSVLLFEATKKRAAKKLAGIPDSLLEKEKEVLANISFLERNVLEESQKKKEEQNPALADWKNKLQESNKVFYEWANEMKAQYPVYDLNSMLNPPIDIGRLQKESLDKNTALIEFVMGEDVGYVFFIVQKDIFHFELKNLPALKTSIEQLLAVISGVPENSEAYTKDYEIFTQLAHPIFQQLLESGLAQMDKAIERLIIIPDGILNYLPFEVLLTVDAPRSTPDFSPKKLAYLMEDYAISYNYSAALVLEQTATNYETIFKDNFVGFAPSFGASATSTFRDCSNAELSNLLCSSEEVEAINELLDGKMFLGKQAVRATFEKEMTKYKVVHLATHACIHKEEQALNKIFFANQEYITQSELNSVSLASELTVLSACNTANGQFKIGEGVMSLARSFMKAGSKSVLTSLWSVDDCATSTIMRRYYELIKKGNPKDMAIGQAKMQFLQEADLNESHPYSWAAIVQFGSATPIAFNGIYQFSWWWISVPVLLLLYLLYKDISVVNKKAWLASICTIFMILLLATRFMLKSLLLN